MTHSPPWLDVFLLAYPYLNSSIYPLGRSLKSSWSHWSMSTSILSIFAGDFLRRP